MGNAYIGMEPQNPFYQEVRSKYTASNGQTLFTGLAYKPGYIDVYVNGSKLVDGTDFTALTGNSVTMSVALTAGDVIEIQTQVPTQIVDTLTHTTGVPRAELAGNAGARRVGYLPADTGAVERTVEEKLREWVSIDDYPSLLTAFAELGGAEGTGYGADQVYLDLLGKEVTFSGTIYVPINVSIVNGTITATGSSRLVFRNPYLANTGLRGYTEYWPYMKGRHRGVKFNCRVIVNVYIGGDFEGCDFTGANGAFVMVNSNGLWTEFNTFRRCSFSANSGDGAAVLLDGNSSGTSTFSTGSGAGTADGSFGYNSFIDCKGDATAPTVMMKLFGGAVLYNSKVHFRGYQRSAGGAFIYIEAGRIGQCDFGFNLESFSAASNAISLANSSDAQLWYNTGYIQSASPEITFSQGAAADLRGNDITVIGCVLQDASGSTVFQGDQLTTKIVTHLLKRGVPSRAPAFSAYPAADQSFSSNQVTKVTLGTEEFDTNGSFASSCFTPTVPGYYQINAQLKLGATSSALAGILHLYKNGSAYRTIDNGTLGAAMTRTLSTVVYMDGTTDYLEMHAYVFDNGGSPSVVSGISNTFLNGCLLKAD